MPPGFRKQLANQQDKIQWLEGLWDFHGIHCSSGRVSGHPLQEILGVLSPLVTTGRWICSDHFPTPRDLPEERDPLGHCPEEFKLAFSVHPPLSQTPNSSFSPVGLLPLTLPKQGLHHGWCQVQEIRTMWASPGGWVLPSDQACGVAVLQLQFPLAAEQ